MKFISQFVQLNLLISFLTFPAVAQTDSTNSKVVDLQKCFQETVKKYEAFETEHGHFIQTPNVNMHYLTWGRSTNIPLVWVHGTTSNGYEAAIFADSLVKKGFYLIAIDYYGHGKTSFPANEVSIYSVADDIYFLLNKLNIKKTIIGGWSRGGSIATAFYDTYPTMVLGIVLEDGGSVGWTRPLYKLGQNEMAKRLTDLFKGFEGEKEEAFPSLFNAYIKYQTNGNLSLGEFHSINKTPTGQWAWNPGVNKWLGETSTNDMIKSLTSPTESQLFEFSTLMLEPKIVYRNLQKPLLIFDPIDSTDLLKDFKQENTALKQQHPKWITHLVYENTGHAVKYQHPEWFYNDLILFLDRIKLQKGNSPVKK